jgi:hypothetical protein
MCNTHLPVYNSWTWDPFTSGVDALAQQDWSQHNNYVNPPFRLLPKVLEVIKSQKATATIIAPYWPGQPWFHDMMKLLVHPPLKIPKAPQTLVRSVGTMIEPLRNHKWRIYAWKVCGKEICKDKDGRSELQNNSC